MPILSVLSKNVNFAIFAVLFHTMLTKRQSDFKPNFWKCLDKNDIRQNVKDKTCRVKCLRGLMLRFVGIIILFKVMEAGFFSLTVFRLSK